MVQGCNDRRGPIKGLQHLPEMLGVERAERRARLVGLLDVEKIRLIVFAQHTDPAKCEKCQATAGRVPRR